VRCNSAFATTRHDRLAVGERRDAVVAARADERRASGTVASSCSGYDDPPSPPGDVHSSASRSTRSGQVTASSWATTPPKLTLASRNVDQPSWSATATASAAYSAIVYGGIREGARVGVLCRNHAGFVEPQCRTVSGSSHGTTVRRHDSR
jgi:hypothetical protein